jgi:hypothetical protein
MLRLSPLVFLAVILTLGVGYAAALRNPTAMLLSAVAAAALLVAELARNRRQQR